MGRGRSWPRTARSPTRLLQVLLGEMLADSDVQGHPPLTPKEAMEIAGRLVDWANKQGD